MGILLVDDQPEGLIALEAILQELGENLVKARSGREALRHLLNEDFAVILLDIQMPEMDGYETAALIREKQRCRHTPIIFLTASHAADVQIMRGYEIGAVDYMFKPLEPVVLRSKVSVFVELARKTELIRKQTEQLYQREQESRRLAETQAELLLALEQRNGELAAVNTELESFSYSVSHDLRAPLRSIDGFSHALLETSFDRLDDQGRRHLRYVRDAAQRMAALIDDLLELARVTRAELRRERVDLTAIARTVGTRLQGDGGNGERQVEFVVHRELVANGDPRLLAVVLENLLGNAWKFTSKRPMCRIEFGLDSKNGQSAFFVRDDGAGFDMAYASKLFGAFQRLHSTADFAGTGIGLATVHRIVRRHGGRIWAEGSVDHGATFYFTLCDEDRQQP